MVTNQTGQGLFDEAEAIEFVRAFIDHRCIFRSPPGKALLVSKDAGRFTWQFYFPIATLNQYVAVAIGKLFWRRYISVEHYRERPFQLCAIESGGVPVACAIQSVAFNDHEIALDVFEAKKKPKDYGIKNWLEGVARQDVPVILVDDVIGGGRTLTTHARRLREFGLDVIGAFAVASCKRKPPLDIELEPGKVIKAQALLGPESFARTHEHYVAKYKRLPQFQGTVV